MSWMPALKVTTLARDARTQDEALVRDANLALPAFGGRGAARALLDGAAAKRGGKRKK